MEVEPVAMSLQFTRLVADENVPREVIDLLKDMGFKEVYWILEKRPGISDPEVWRLAAGRNAVLLTGDIGYMSQLGQADILNGPNIVEYATRGFAKNELQDPELMKVFLNWLFRNGHHEGREHLELRIDGRVRTRRQLWGEENRRRRRQR